MPTPIFCCGFECGILSGGATVNTEHFQGANGSPGLSTTTVNNGARSFRANDVASSTFIVKVFSASNELRLIGRIYIYFATLPSADTPLVNHGDSSSGPCVAFKNSDSSIYAGVMTTGAITFGASGVIVRTGVWYRIDFDSQITVGGNDTCNVQVDGAAVGQATATGANAGNGQIWVGNINTCTADIFFDDVLLSLTGADYPLGPGKILSYVPDSDGTHTFTTTNAQKGTIAAPTGGGNITSATNDAFNWVNGIPLLGGAADNTRLINQATASALQYAEVDFQPTTEVVPPRAVEVITADRQAGTAAGVFQTKLNDNGTENAIANAGSVSGTTSDKYVTKQYATMPADSAAWTLTRFNALKARFGYSSDATPDQYWRGIMIEAEFALPVLPIPTMNRVIYNRL